VEGGKPRRRVQDGLHVHLRLGMDDLETSEENWRD